MHEHGAQWCYQTLALKPGSSRVDAQAAYRLLAKVWHPDRFEHDPARRLSAQKQLKGINEASTAPPDVQTHLLPNPEISNHL